MNPFDNLFGAERTFSQSVIVATLRNLADALEQNPELDAVNILRKTSEMLEKS